MQVSYFETARYQMPPGVPAEWPVPPGAYDSEAGMQAYQGMVERLTYVEELGFDWVSVSEHHYSPRILTPNPNISASFLAARSEKIKIAVLGPIVSQSNPVQVAEELAMLDNLAQGRLVVGLLRGTTNEYLTYGLNPAEARERTTEGMELILKAWTEPQPFGWQGRHFHYRTVSVWPRPLQQPHPATYSLGTSAESCEFASRHHIGLGVSFAPFEVVSKSARYYRESLSRTLLFCVLSGVTGIICAVMVWPLREISQAPLIRVFTSQKHEVAWLYPKRTSVRARAPVRSRTTSSCLSH